MASFFADILASLTFADMADNGGRDDEQFIFISLRARLPNRIYIFIIYQPHLCFRLDTIEWSSFTNHYLWRHHPLSSLMRITRFHRQIFIKMEPKKYTQWVKKIALWSSRNSKNSLWNKFLWDSIVLIRFRNFITVISAPFVHTYSVNSFLTVQMRWLSPPGSPDRPDSGQTWSGLNSD